MTSRHCERPSDEAIHRQPDWLTALAKTPCPAYLAAMHDDPELKRLHWRAHHRGTREADMLVGGFFDAHHRQWSAAERAMFDAMLEEQDVDIMAWALGTLPVPERFAGAMIAALQKLDYIQVAR